MSLILELTGWEEFSKFLRDFPSRVRIAMEDAAEESSRLIAQSAKRRAPKRTGKLRESIKAIGFIVEVKAEYARFLEFGTKKMKSQPFLRPAILENMDKVRNIFYAKIKDELRRGLQ